MYKRHVILDPRYKFESNIVRENLYGTNSCSSNMLLKVAMIAKRAIL